MHDGVISRRDSARIRPCRSIWHKCAACIRRMQFTKGFGLSQQAFCNAKMAFVYTDALLATIVLVLKGSQPVSYTDAQT